MKKRGQATVFIIVGIVIVLLVILLFYIRGDITIGKLTPEQAQNVINSQVQPIKEHIGNCISEEGYFTIKSLALRGGSLNPTQFVLYNGESIQYLCTEEDGITTCVQNILTKEKIGQEISNSLQDSLPACININQFGSGLKKYDLTAGELKVNSEINDNNVKITLDYPITLLKDTAKIDIEEFTGIVNVPLGKLHDISIDVVNTKAMGEYFDTTKWMVNHNGEVLIEVKKPYPDEVYILTPQDGSGIVFNFAIEGISEI